MKNISLVLVNKEMIPLLWIDIPNFDLTFDGCLIRNSKTLFISLRLQDVQVSHVTFGLSRKIFDSKLFSRKFYDTNKLFLTNRHNCAWLK